MNRRKTTTRGNKCLAKKTETKTMSKSNGKRKKATGSGQQAAGSRQMAAGKWQKAALAKTPFGQGMRHGRRPRRGFPLAPCIN